MLFLFDTWPGIEQFQLRESGMKVLGWGAEIYCLGKAIIEGRGKETRRAVFIVSFAFDLLPKCVILPHGRSLLEDVGERN